MLANTVLLIMLHLVEMQAGLASTQHHSGRVQTPSAPHRSSFPSSENSSWQAYMSRVSNLRRDTALARCLISPQGRHLT